MPNPDLRDQIAYTIHTSPFEYLRDSREAADAILALPAIAAGQAALALLTGAVDSDCEAGNPPPRRAKDIHIETVVGPLPIILVLEDDRGRIEAYMTPGQADRLASTLATIAEGEAGA